MDLDKPQIIDGGVNLVTVDQLKQKFFSLLSSAVDSNYAFIKDVYLTIWEFLITKDSELSNSQLAVSFESETEGIAKFRLVMEALAQ